MASSNMPQRPGLVTLIGLVIWIQAIIAAVIAVTSFVLRNDTSYQETLGKTADQLTTTAWIEGILAVVLVLVALGIMRGSPGARTLVSIVMAARIGYGIFTMITHTGGYVGAAAISIGLSMFVLWALYDRQEARAYFAG